jgi:hypothetical protein
LTSLKKIGFTVRKLAVADIHGCMDQLDALLESIAPDISIRLF